jgi:hypothetical protein
MNPGFAATPSPSPDVLTIPLSATSWIRKPGTPCGRCFPPTWGPTGLFRLTKGSRRPWGL